MTPRNVRLLALPYGAAAILVLVTWLAGGLIGAEPEFGWRGWIVVSLVLLAIAGWLTAMAFVIRHLRRWALLAAPSAMFVVLTATGIPLLMGACMLAKACI